jgi:glycosyltransferase involved in cell wall biosynthesis
MGVSVVIPVFNGADSLASAVKSVYAQTSPPDELVVIDDGSTDGTRDLLSQLAPNAPIRFRWKSQANRGEADARNRCVEAANHDLIAFLDHDDVWHPRKLEHQLAQLAHQPSLGASVTAIEIVSQGSREVRRQDQWSAEPESLLEQLILSNVFAVPSAVLVRRQALRRAPPFLPVRPYGCDWLMWLRLVGAGLKVGYVQEPLVEYRRHRTNMSSPRMNIEVSVAVCDHFFRTWPGSISAADRERDGRWWRAHMRLRAAVWAVQNGELNMARRHLIRAALIRPASVRPGWTRLVGLWPPPP